LRGEKRTIEGRARKRWGALFGFFCYATFELTSLSLLKHWTWAVVLVDVAWGTFVTAVSSPLGLMIANWVAPKIWSPSFRGDANGSAQSAAR
jgi:Predicted membrane protein (DUF2177)